MQQPTEDSASLNKAVPEHRLTTDINGADGTNADTASLRQHLFRVVGPVEQTVFSGIDRAHEGPRRYPLTPEKADRYKLLPAVRRPEAGPHPSPRMWGPARGWEETKAAYRAARPDAEQRRRRRWFETGASNRESRGASRKRDRDRANADLGNLSERFERMADAGTAAAARLGGHITASMVLY
ncbi:hypothetical protein DL770_009721 [Monosporascus sp. CRB-9-2]|nr:hypothetical protein DL770_009721 [Monosporascus sp. CRB-9-2]